MSDSRVPYAAHVLRPACLPGVELLRYTELGPGLHFVAPWYSAALLQEGEGAVRRPRGELPCPRQAAILINPGELFLARYGSGGHGSTRGPGTGPGTGASSTHVHVAGEVLARAYEEAGGRGALRFPLEPRDGRALAEGLLRLERQLFVPDSVLGTQQTFAAWLALLLRNAEAPPPEPRGLHEPRATARARELLHERLEPEFGLPELAAEVGLSKAYLVRAFKRELGIPPHEYQMQLRVAHARRLLAAGVPATQVAQDAGFYDQSHLTRWFKRVLGVTPGAYAQAVR
ncbi:MAG: AraC family transcriptional regulator [Polyangia bacterium]